MAASAVGLRSLYAFIEKDRSVSMCYLSGFSRLFAGMLRYAAVCAVASRPTEALLMSLLEDDRVVRQLDTYEEVCADELRWIEDAPEELFELLAISAGQPSTARSIRSACTSSAHTSVAGVEKRFFSQVRYLPWSLARGCIARLLRALTASDAPAEETTFRIWSLLKLGVNACELQEAIGFSGVPLVDECGGAAARHVR
jgi:hypothetical protein